MIGFYNYTVILTYISLIISSFGISLAVTGKPYGAVLCLVASGVCDMFDGKIARTRKESTDEERRFGIQLDSLCDIVCFGVLPAAIGVSLFDPGAFPVPHYACRTLGALLILCALIRLAYFNVTEETRQATEMGRRTHYEGLPVTSDALIFPFAYLMTRLLPHPAALFVYPAFLLVTAVLFISPIRVPKPHGRGLVFLSLIGLCELAALACLYMGLF